MSPGWGHPHTHDYSRVRELGSVTIERCACGAVRHVYPADTAELAPPIPELARRMSETATRILDVDDDELAAEMAEARSRVCVCGHHPAEHDLDDDDQWIGCVIAGCACRRYEGPS